MPRYHLARVDNDLGNISRFLRDLSSDCVRASMRLCDWHHRFIWPSSVAGARNSVVSARLRLIVLGVLISARPALSVFNTVFRYIQLSSQETWKGNEGAKQSALAKMGLC